jgi:hypothetical protein
VQARTLPISNARYAKTLWHQAVSIPVFFSNSLYLSGLMVFQIFYPDSPGLALPVLPVFITTLLLTSGFFFFLSQFRSQTGNLFQAALVGIGFILYALLCNTMNIYWDSTRIIPMVVSLASVGFAVWTYRNAESLLDCLSGRYRAEVVRQSPVVILPNTLSPNWLEHLISSPYRTSILWSFSLLFTYFCSFEVLRMILSDAAMKNPVLLILFYITGAIVVFTCIFLSHSCNRSLSVYLQLPVSRWKNFLMILSLPCLGLLPILGCTWISPTLLAAFYFVSVTVWLTTSAGMLYFDKMGGLVILNTVMILIGVWLMIYFRSIRTGMVDTAHDINLIGVGGSLVCLTLAVGWIWWSMFRTSNPLHSISMKHV